MSTTSWGCSWAEYTAARDRFFAGLAGTPDASEPGDGANPAEPPPVDAGEGSAPLPLRSSSPAS
jgi:hypothetical protein